MNPIWKLLVLVAIFDFGTCKYLLKPDKETLPYRTKSHQELKIKVMIHFDPTLTRKLTSSTKYHKNATIKLKMLSKKILSEAETILKHESLGQKINLELIDTKFLKNLPDLIAMDENASKYLKSYCLWQSKKKTDRLYYSVLFTGLDLFYLNAAGKEIRTSTGRGFKGGMCMVKSSCTVIEWKEVNAGYLLAHEIGHSLGMSHDGDILNGNRCKPKGFIMERRYDARKHSTAWSSCSRGELQKYLSSDKGSCLKYKGSKRMR